MKYLIFLLLLITGCSLYRNSSGKTYSAGAFTGAHRLIPIAANDTSYTNYFNVRDTTTRDGWKIQYLVMDDATRHTDAYIQWEKGDVKRVYRYNNVLQYRGSFMPQLLEESDTHIFMEHWCATDCMAVLALPKNGRDDAMDIEAIIDHNLRSGQFVYREYKDNGAIAATAIDLKRRKKRSVTFKNKIYSMGNSFVKSIIFKGSSIVIEGEFFDKDGETVKEVQTIRF
ncbi:hypothetical protein [Flavobacterium sp.]|uniref:hypothetical protein n=1 Tax=Flavobacterium sp. TaxID=239 RepID=UPI0040340534